jgi:CheY-like chemotaxis protein
VPRPTKTLLVIEDEPALRRVMERILRTAGYQVLLATDGKDGLEQFRAHQSKIDLILTDLEMPSFGGRDVVAGIRAAGSPLPVLLVTGYAAEHVDEIDDRHVWILTKPWTLSRRPS